MATSPQPSSTGAYAVNHDAKAPGGPDFFGVHPVRYRSENPRRRHLEEAEVLQEQSAAFWVVLSCDPQGGALDCCEHFLGTGAQVLSRARRLYHRGSFEIERLQIADLRGQVEPEDARWVELRGTTVDTLSDLSRLPSVQDCKHPGGSRPSAACAVLPLPGGAQT